jgi:cell division protein FtsN
MSLGAAAAQNHLGSLGITEGRAREAVFDSFITDTISLAGDSKAFTGAAAGARVALVNFALTLARTFAETDDFKRRYADHRDANGPDPLPEEPSVDAILAKQRAGFEEQVLQMRKLFDQITPEQRATLEEGWKDMRAQLTELESGPKRAELEQALRQQHAGQARERELAMKELETVWPADHRALIASRLRHFLEVSKDVVYDAKLVEHDGKKRFADPALEARPKEWKMCFRAGKPATDAARAFAEKWLNDLAAAGVK